MIDALDIPPFLRAARSARLPREPRWKRMPKAARPQGEIWADAERWEICVGLELSYTSTSGRAAGLASGWRRVWVVEGRKWVRLCDGADKVKIPLETWRKVQRHGRQVPR